MTITAEICNGTNHDPGTVAFAVQAGWPFSCTPETRTFGIDSTTGSAGMLYLGCEGNCAEDPFVWAHYFAATEADPIPPVVETLGGSALAAGVLRGHQTLTAEAKDEGGGVSNLAVTVNGRPAAAPLTPPCQIAQVANSSVTGTVATTPTPCPSEAHAEWTLDTAVEPFGEGANTIQVCAEDFATLGQPNQGCSAPVTVDVDNSCAESAPTGGTAFNVGFTRTKGLEKTVGFGKGADVEGRLLGVSGNPIPGATVCIATATEGPNRAFVPTAMTSTDGEGRFQYAVPPGPNRKLRFAYRHDSSQIEGVLTLDTRARPTLLAGPRQLDNGQRVTLRGRLPEPAAAGRVVVLQAAVPRAHRWITFRKATTGHRGRFKADYHFTSTTRKITYRFRAVVPRQAGYPWAQGTSRPAPVTVTGRRPSMGHRSRSRRNR